MTPYAYPSQVCDNSQGRSATKSNDRREAFDVVFSNVRVSTGVRTGKGKMLSLIRQYWHLRSFGRGVLNDRNFPNDKLISF